MGWQGKESACSGAQGEKHPYNCPLTSADGCGTHAPTYNSVNDGLKVQAEDEMHSAASPVS